MSLEGDEKLADFIVAFNVIATPPDKAVIGGRVPLYFVTNVDAPTSYSLTIFPFDTVVVARTWQIGNARILASGAEEWGFGQVVDLYGGGILMGKCIVLEPLGMPGSADFGKWEYRGKWPDARAFSDDL